MEKNVGSLSKIIHVGHIIWFRLFNSPPFASHFIRKKMNKAFSEPGYAKSDPITCAFNLITN